MWKRWHVTSAGGRAPGDPVTPQMLGRAGWGMHPARLGAWGTARRQDIGPCNAAAHEPLQRCSTWGPAQEIGRGDTAAERVAKQRPRDPTEAARSKKSWGRSRGIRIDRWGEGKAGLNTGKEGVGDAAALVNAGAALALTCATQCAGASGMRCAARALNASVAGGLGQVKFRVGPAAVDRPQNTGGGSTSGPGVNCCGSWHLQ